MTQARDQFNGTTTTITVLQLNTSKTDKTSLSFVSLLVAS